MKNKIIFKDDGEDNGYHDSYFYFVYYDIDLDVIVKHTHGSTAYYGSQELEDSEKIADLSDPEQKEIMAKVVACSEKEALAALRGNQIRYPHKGDLVVVSNKNARKHKLGTIFTADFVEETRFRHVVTEYLNGEDGIRTNLNNCSIIEPTERHVKDVADNIRFGIRLR